jgi:hypothetical protein
MREKMPCINNLNSFPYIFQGRIDWCIPASIENVMKYYRNDIQITQQQIIDLYTEVFDLETLCFENVSQVLNDEFGDNYTYTPNTWNTTLELVNYIEDSIENNIPVIVAMDLPDREGIHMVTVLCYRNRFFRVFDTGFRAHRPRNMNREFFINHLTHNRATLTITQN